MASSPGSSYPLGNMLYIHANALSSAITQVTGFSFANSDQGPPLPRSHAKMKTFNETLFGLVTQFAASSTPPVAIEILNTAASGTKFPLTLSSFFANMPLQPALQNPATLFQIFEETLHAYFTQCTKPNALIGTLPIIYQKKRPHNGLNETLTEAAASLQKPVDMKWEQFTSICTNCHTCLTLLVLNSKCIMKTTQAN